MSVPPARARRRHAHLAAALVLGLVGVTAVAASAGAVGGPSVGGGTAGYTEQAAPTLVGADVTVAGGGSFAGQHVDFAVTDATSAEALSLQTDGGPVATDGVVSVVGASVYLGNGSGADVIGSIDPTLDGQGGRALRVNFTSAFTNASFETGSLTGWTTLDQRIDLGTTAIAGFVSQDTSTYPGQAPNADNNAPSSLGSLNTTVQNSVVSDGGYALRLVSSGMTTLQGYDVVHGPAVYSSPFEAAAGDSIYFDWRAYAGDDDYHVFGYLIDSHGNQLEVLDATGAGTTAWTTKETVIPASGTYRFVFVSGTFDASGGQAAGASLVIDNVRVFGTKAVDVVVQQIARRLQYANSSDVPPATRTITVSATSTQGTGSAAVTVAITPVDDGPTVGAPAPVTLTNTEGAQTYPATTGSFTTSDPEGDTPTYALDGGVEDVRTIGGVGYTESVTGTYGTLHLDATSGAYVFVPDADAIDGRLVDDVETFGLTSTTNGLVGTGTLTVVVDVPASAPGAPTGVGAVAGAEQVGLTWTPPTWLGGSAITGYVVESSLDGSTWTTALTTSDATPAATVTGLTNGTPVHVRVRAVNATGTGAASAVRSATPVDVPDAPAAPTVTPDDRAVTLGWSAPADTGGTAVTGYRVEISTDGSSWTTAIADTGSTLTGARVSGLANGVAVTFRVSALNAVGAGVPSATVTATPRTVPTAPRSATAVPGDGTVTLSWSAPADDGGAPVTGYRVTLSADGGTTWTTAAETASTSTQLTGLANGAPVLVRVAAVNAAGTGPAGATVVSTPRTVPGAPVVTKAESGNRNLTLHFMPPTSDGGASVLTYQYSLDGGTTWAVRRTGSTGSPLVVGGLENGVLVTVLVRAVNEAGAGAASAPVTATPRLGPVTTPGISGPVVPELEPGDSRLLVDGRGEPVETSTSSGAFEVSGDGFTVTLQALAASGVPASVDQASGRLVVRADGSVAVSGSGFRPGSTVDVWLFSTPYLLGEVAVGGDGTFAARLPLPVAVEAGEHTVQLNGLADDGAVRSLATGVVVREVPAAPSGRLAATGGDAAGLVVAQLALMGLGLVLVAGAHGARRRMRA